MVFIWSYFYPCRLTSIYIIVFHRTSTPGKGISSCRGMVEITVLKRRHASWSISLRHMVLHYSDFSLIFTVAKSVRVLLPLYGKTNFNCVFVPCIHTLLDSQWWRACYSMRRGGAWGTPCYAQGATYNQGSRKAYYVQYRLNTVKILQ